MALWSPELNPQPGRPAIRLVPLPAGLDKRLRVPLPIICLAVSLSLFPGNPGLGYAVPLVWLPFTIIRPGHLSPDEPVNRSRHALWPGLTETLDIDPGQSRCVVMTRGNVGLWRITSLPCQRGGDWLTSLGMALPIATQVFDDNPSRQTVPSRGSASETAAFVCTRPCRVEQCIPDWAHRNAGARHGSVGNMVAADTNRTSPRVETPGNLPTSQG